MSGSVFAGDDGMAGTAETDDRQNRTEQAALGRALEARSGDIVSICRRRYVDHIEGLTFESVELDHIRDLCAPAVTVVANWLQSAAVQFIWERVLITSIGDEEALGEEPILPRGTGVVIASPGGRRDRTDPPSSAPSVTMLVKLNLLLKDCMRSALVEEANRLGTGTASLRVATEMVTASCDSNMLRMAKRYDAGRRERRDRLWRYALRDPLTGLANRAVLISRLDRAIGALARRPGGLAVAFIDLHNFKMNNDSLGHGRGDELLKAMAERLDAQVRSGDTIARFGGDEFVVLFEDLTEPVFEEAWTLAERLHRVAGEPVQLADEQLSITASIGVAVVGGLGCGADEILARADTAMYEVKRAGRNAVAVIEIDNGYTAAPATGRVPAPIGVSTIHQP